VLSEADFSLCLSLLFYSSVLEEDTSVNAVLREYLEEYAGNRREQIEAAKRILASSRDSASRSGPGGRRWTREELYEERLGRYRRK
jgi:hypothetical protein